ncbi:Central glycolytic genes regulator [Geobacillus sp. BCO2]|nr:Central glycolytic genes regulator [Geobacillus sp. BCO2]
MKELLEPGDIVAVAGGTTMAAVAEMMTPDAKLRDVLFVPARGGLAKMSRIRRTRFVRKWRKKRWAAIGCCTCLTS